LTHQVGTGLHWTGLNKGKRSVTLDFRSDDSPRLTADACVRAAGMAES
jgi:hypothetical protein